MIEDDQSILYSCVKCHNETCYFVQLINSNKIESILMMIIKKIQYIDYSEV